jgi:hypothetical protein
MSQRSLSACTFLKKSILEDLLLITEEVDPDSHDNTTTNVKEPVQTSTSTSTSISDKQIKRLYAIAKNVNVTDEEVKIWIKKKFNLDSKKDLNYKQYDELCTALEKKN